MDQQTSLETIILPQARSLRPGTGTVILHPGNTSQIGRSHDIYIVTLTDTSQILARVAKSQHNLALERRGVDMLEHIASVNPNCRVPKVYWHNLDRQQQNSPRENMIVLQELIPGKPLSVWNSLIPKSQQIRFLDSLAGFLVELWSTPVSESLDTNIPSKSYSQWLEEMIDKAIKRCITGTGKWGTTSDYLVMRSMIKHYSDDVDHVMEYGTAHGDLHAHNILVGERLELTGVVDWDWSFQAPLPAVIQFPWFLADVPGWHNDGPSPGESFHHNRDYLVQAFRAREISKTRSDKLATLLASARERQIFQSAINFRDIHQEFVAKDRRFELARQRDLRPEMEAFLVKHPELRDAHEVQRIMSSK